MFSGSSVSTFLQLVVAHLELLTIKAISYLWVSVCAFHKFIAKQVEQRPLDWQDFKSIQDQATTFFRHSDLRTSRQCTAEGAGLSSNAASFGNHSQAVTPSVTKACRAWNYTGVCDCDQDADAYKKHHHRCRVCKADHPMLHYAKRRTPIPSQ